MEDVAALWATYKIERPTWVAVAETVGGLVRAKIARSGISATVTARAKEIDSLLVTALQKNKGEAIDKVRDKAGVRITAYFPDDISQICEIVRSIESYRVHKEEDKGLALAASRKMGYGGIHFDVVLSAEALPEDADEVVGEFWCEIQVHTAAQSLYANISHPLLYKTPEDPPPSVARAIDRLSVLGEIFDHELLTARKAIMNQPGYPSARVLFALEHHFSSLSGRRGDAALNQVVVDGLLPLYGDSSTDQVEALLADFVERHRGTLEWTYKRQAEGTTEPLVMQPVSLVILERDLVARLALERRWSELDYSAYVLEKLLATFSLSVDV